MPKQTLPPIAVCAFELDSSSPARVQIFPAGRFDAPLGALQGAGPWNLDAFTAAALIRRVQSRKTPVHFDYHHASLTAAQNGHAAPAAGWLETGKLAWEDGKGLFGLGVQWTDKAAAAIAAREYRFLSPVFSYDAKTGTPLDLFSVALTNTPAIDGMADLLAAASLSFNLSEPPVDIDELLAALTCFLRLPLGSTMDDVDAQLAKIKIQLGTGAETAAASAFFGEARNSRTQIAALSAQTPDPALYVPVAALQQSNARLAALEAKLLAQEIDDLIEPALSDGRLLPDPKDGKGQESWARELGKSNLAALQQFLATAQPIAALAGMQTGGRKPDGVDWPTEAVDIAVAATKYQTEQAALGISISDIDAVAHVSTKPGA